MNHARFFRLWILTSLIYLLLSVLGPNGPRPFWPQISQHLLQARAWAGSDIHGVDSQGRDKIFSISPRLDLTPYFAHRLLRDSRENGLISNLAVRVPGPGGRLEPAQGLWDPHQNPELRDQLRCDLGFPPGPSFLLFPLVLLLGSFLATGWLGPVLGGLAVASVDGLVPIWAKIMGLDLMALPPPAIPLLAGSGTLLLPAAPDGGTFLFAQTVGVAGLSLALFLAASGRLIPASIAFGMAITSRPAMLGAVGLYLMLGLQSYWGRGTRDRIRRLLTLMSGPAILGSITLGLNRLRFGSIFRFGYDAMLVPPFLQERLAEHGQLSPAYLGHNIFWVLLHPPMLLRAASDALSFPWLVSNPQGMGLFFVTPAFLALGWAFRAPRPQARVLLGLGWISLGLCALPGLLYYNTGWVQWGGRFLLDAWPIFILLATLGLSRLPRLIIWTLILLSMLSNIWGAIVILLQVWPACCS